ncbi:MAG: diguanylate cyclase [Acidobacteria bacterium]|nr:diguanylate cyclase [Acidobacteriota bacterium]NIO58312.1 diguanylate cyclase [Acidobacteriota bacterium]NIQ29367.1 diguanylate cyclase [Acidobacteriota bacterium]NIQ83968.1 diguanylate cyclase [Acidobacteriota bacterium]
MQRVLVVDDEDGLRTIISQVLKETGYDVTTASSGEAALELFKVAPFPIVMTDIFMGEMTGVELLYEIKELEPNTQVVIMTSNASLESATAALRSGACDYLQKPFEDLDSISAVIDRAAEKVDEIHQAATMVDSLKRNAHELETLNTQLANLATKDALTGLFNRRHFLEAIEYELAGSKRHGRTFSVLFIDLDHFKDYNDTFGHPAGDELLKGLSELFKQNSRSTTTVARYGGEEFILLVPEAPKAGATIFAERLRKTVEEHAWVDGDGKKTRTVSLSIGVSTFPEDGLDAKTIIQRADEALYRAKKEGRNRVVCC